MQRVKVGTLKVNDTFYLITGQHGVVKSFKTTRYATPEGEYVEIVAPYCAIHYEGGMKWKELHPNVEVTIA